MSNISFDGVSSFDGFLSGKKVRIASVSDLRGFQTVSSNKLVHLSNQDFWKLGQDEEGYFIERLVDSNDPVKG